MAGNTTYANFYNSFRNDVRKFGTIEWWIYRNESNSNHFRFIFRDENWDPAMVLNVDNSNEIYYLKDGFNNSILSSSFQDNKWHHFRLDFECSDNKYEGLKRNRFNLYLDNVKIGNNLYMRNEKSNYIGYFEFDSFKASNLRVYLDYVAYSWDRNYNIGDNQFYNFSIPSNFSYEKVLNYDLYSLFKK